MKAKDYLEKKPNRSARKKAELYERKNWHLTQILGAILFASEDPEKGFTIPEKDVLDVNIADVEWVRELDDKGRPMLTVRIKSISLGDEDATTKVA